jgi:hypothetical protein
MADTSFRNCSEKIRPWLITKGLMTVDTSGKKFNKVRELTITEYNLLVSENSSVFNQTEIDSCLRQMRYTIPKQSSLFNTLTLGLAGNETSVDPTQPFSLNIEVDVVPDNAATQTPGKVMLGNITAKKIDNLKEVTGPSINSDTQPKELAAVINSTTTGLDDTLKTAFNNIYTTKKSRGQTAANVLSLGVFGKLTETQLRDDALAAIDEALLKIKTAEEDPNGRPIGVFDPKYKIVLIALKDYIFKKGTGTYADEKGVFFLPDVGKFWTGYNLNYKKDVAGNTESALYKLKYNLKQMIFINRGPDGDNWARNIPDNERQPIFDARKKENSPLPGLPERYYFPGFDRDKLKDSVYSVGFTNRAAYFTDPKMFLDKILNYRINTDVLRGLVKGGKHTRKHKKSNTQKAGRKNKKTRKH